MTTFYNERTNTMTGSVDWKDVAAEIHQIVNLDTIDGGHYNNLYGIRLGKTPRSGSLRIFEWFPDESESSESIAESESSESLAGGSEGTEFTETDTFPPSAGYFCLSYEDDIIYFHFDHNLEYVRVRAYQIRNSINSVSNIRTMVQEEGAEVAGLGDLNDIDSDLDNTSAVTAINDAYSINDAAISALESSKDGEYVYNTDTSDADDTTSFATGEAGGTVPSVSSTAKEKRVRFSQHWKHYVLEINPSGEGEWIDVGSSDYCRQTCYPSASALRYGISLRPVTGSSTDIDVSFAPYGVQKSDGTSAWSTENSAGTKYRVWGHD